MIEEDISYNEISNIDVVVEMTARFLGKTKDEILEKVDTASQIMVLSRMITLCSDFLTHEKSEGRTLTRYQLDDLNNINEEIISTIKEEPNIFKTETYLEKGADGVTLPKERSLLSFLTSQSSSFFKTQIIHSLLLSCDNLQPLLDESTKVALLSNIISGCAYRVQEELSESDSKKLASMKREIISFIDQDPDIIRMESSKETNPLTKKSSLHPEDTKSLSAGSLLFTLLSSVTKAYSVEIVNHLIKGSEDLSKREDLLQIMIQDRTISSDPDMSETLDLLVQKGLPLPTESQMKSLMKDTRLNDGRNASKLAKSFFQHRNDISLIKQVLDYPQNTIEKKELKTFLTNGGMHDDLSCIRHINCLVEINNDALLETALANRKLDGALSRSNDHTPTLNLAVGHKFTKTFEVLVDAGFNPLKHPEGVTNPIAIACQTQSRNPLESYLASVEKKLGKNTVAELINEVDAAGKTALTHAVEGRAYIDAINLLLSQGADSSINHLLNLEKCVLNGHAGAFDLLLRKTSPSKVEIDRISQVVATADDYVMESVLLEYVKGKDATLEASLKNKINEKYDTLKPSDLFRICQLNGGKSLEYYVIGMSQTHENYSLSDHVNNMDDHCKTPLYYAINNNAYNRVVSILLENQADVNIIGHEGETTDSSRVNALSLAIKNGESATLEILSRSNNILPTTLVDAAVELVKPQNNVALLTKAFVENLTEDQLSLLPTEPRLVLLKRSLESNLDKSIEKIKGSFAGNPEDLTNYVDHLFLEAIKNSDNKMVDKLFENLGAQNLTSHSRSSSGKASEIDLSETSALLETNISNHNYNAIRTPNSSLSTASSSTSRLSDYNNIYLDTALESACQASSEKEVEAKGIIKTLREKGFKTSLPKNEYKRKLKSLDLDDSYWCCPTDYNACRIM